MSGKEHIVNYKDIAIAWKTPGLDQQARATRQSFKQIATNLMKQKRSLRTFETRDRQMAALENFRRVFPGADFVSWGECTVERFKKKKLVISHGGDEQGKYVGQFLGPQIPLLICNSDPKLSFGALSSYVADDAEEIRSLYDSKSLQYERWPRIHVRIKGNDGVVNVTATSEILIAEAYAGTTSRHLFKDPNGNEYSHGGSGLYIGNGSCSTGWGVSIGRSADPETGKAKLTFFNKPRTEEKIYWLHREPWPGILDPKTTLVDMHPLERGFFQKGQTIEVISRNSVRNGDQRGGIIDVDPGNNYIFPFEAGAQASISFGPSLTIVKHH